MDWWHIPTRNEWYTMTHYLDSTVTNTSGYSGADIVDKLKQGWSSGFNGIYTWFRGASTSFVQEGSYTGFWTSSSTSTWGWMDYFVPWHSNIYTIYDLKSDYGYSVRCIKN